MKNIWVEVATLAIIVALIVGSYLTLANTSKDTTNKATSAVKSWGDNITP